MIIFKYLKKLNKKGITIVELLITFVILMGIVVGMMNVVLEIRSMVNDQSFIKEAKEYKTMMTHTIQSELMKHDYSKITDCSDQYNVCGNISFTDGKSLKININTVYKEISITKDGTKINYKIPNSDDINFMNNYANLNNFTNDKNLLEKGEVYIKLKGEFLEINIPYFKTVLLDNDPTSIFENMNLYNYGFKVVYPINL